MLAQNTHFLPAVAAKGEAAPARAGYYGMPFGWEYALLPRWGAIRRLYIRIFGIVDLPSRLRARFIIREIRRLRVKSTLDIGSGTGSYSFFLSRNPGIQVDALDIDPRRISDCCLVAKRLRRPNLRFTTCSAEAGLSQYASDSMDLVLAVEVLQYCDSAASVLREIRRLLKPGGSCIVHVPALGYLRPSETQLFDDDSLKRLAEEAGFACASIRSTLGGGHRYGCRIFDRISRSHLLTAVFFPFLLVFSLPFGFSTDTGDHRLLVLHKPLAEPASIEPPVI